MKEWGEVTSLPEFQALDDKERKIVAKQYNHRRILHKIKAKPHEERDYNESLYKDYIPSSVRTFLSTAVGDKSDITEDNFSKKELGILRNAVKRAEKRGDNQLSYGDYGEKSPYAIGHDQLMSALFDTGGSLANTFGTATFKKDENGDIIITDTYDFEVTRKQLEDAKRNGNMPSYYEAFISNGLIGVGNLMGNKSAPIGEGRAVKVRISGK